MTEESRGAAREAAGREQPTTAPEGAAPDSPPDLADENPSESRESEEFAAGTLNAERLRSPEAPDYKDRWLRAEAEVQNTRRRATRDRDDAVRSAEDRLLVDLIEMLDDLERALALLTPEQAADPWSQGVLLTAQRMRDALARRGVTPIAALGQLFDPAFHEALLEVPAAEGVKPGHVAQEVQKGYQRGERALRPARVVVARADG